MIELVFPESLRVGTIEEAEPYYRSDCEYCVLSMELAKEKNLRVIINIETRDWIGVCP